MISGVSFFFLLLCLLLFVCGATSGANYANHFQGCSFAASINMRCGAVEVMTVVGAIQ